LIWGIISPNGKEVGRNLRLSRKKRKIEKALGKPAGRCPLITGGGKANQVPMKTKKNSNWING